MRRRKTTKLRNEPRMRRRKTTKLRKEQRRRRRKTTKLRNSTPTKNSTCRPPLQQRQNFSSRGE